MMQPWFTQAKLGIFIHWGSYAVGRRGGESWPIANGDVSHQQYIAEMKDFDAKDYDPKSWADLFKRAGARYSVLTTKHHDGVTLWPTKEDSPSIPATCGMGDLIGPYCEAIREAGLNVGLYFSHTDWSHRGHIKALTGKTDEELTALQAEPNNWRDILGEGGILNPGPEEHKHWETFIQFHRAQIKELLTEYAPVDLIWFDVLWGADRLPYDCKQLRDFIHEHSPATVINSRMEGHGDYETPEQFIPVYPPEGPWELCMTTNNSWSFTGSEAQYKSPFELVKMFCECLGMGGNMLLNVGPDEHGVLPEQQVKLLEAMGEWIGRNEAAVYQTQRGLPAGYSYHHSSLSLDRNTLYVYLAHLPSLEGEPTSIKGIRNEIKSMTLLGSEAACAYKRVGGAPWLNVPGTLFINIPKEGRDPLLSVLKIELEGELDLYDGHGVEIDQN